MILLNGAQGLPLMVGFLMLAILGLVGLVYLVTKLIRKITGKDQEK
jgi:hypothetical protein